MRDGIYRTTEGKKLKTIIRYKSFIYLHSFLLLFGRRRGGIVSILESIYENFSKSFNITNLYFSDLWNVGYWFLFQETVGKITYMGK